MPESKDLVPQTENPLAHLVQDNVDLMGTENVDREDLKLPRLKICQEGTKEEDRKGAPLGVFFNSITGKQYGKKILIIPVSHWKSNIKFENNEETCRSIDGKVNSEGKSCIECGDYKFSKDGIKPSCSKSFCYFAGVEEEIAEAIKLHAPILPLVVYFNGVSTKVGKEINTNVELNAGRKFPIYSQFFEITVPETQKEFKVGKAFIPEVKAGRYATPEEALFLKAMFLEFRKLKVDVNASDVKENEPVDTTSI